MSLRNATIRLAHERPELRAHLLPLLAGHASLRSAGLFDLDLLRKFVQAVLQDEPTESAWRTFDEFEMSNVDSSYDAKAGWVFWRTASRTAGRYSGPSDSYYDPPDDEDEPPEEEAEAFIPTGATGTFVFTLSKKPLNLLMQVPEAQRVEFLTGALRILFTKHSNYFFQSALLPGIGMNLSAEGAEGWAEWEYDSKSGDEWGVHKVNSMKVQKMESIGKPRMSSGIARWKFRFDLTFDVSFEYTAHRHYEKPEPDGDWD